MVDSWTFLGEKRTIRVLAPRGCGQGAAVGYPAAR